MDGRRTNQNSPQIPSRRNPELRLPLHTDETFVEINLRTFVPRIAPARSGDLGDNNIRPDFLRSRFHFALPNVRHVKAQSFHA